MTDFKLVAPFKPSGQQPGAITELTDGLARDDRHQVLLGVTGSGKTFTIANVIQTFNRPTLVLAHNKTLAAQLYEEFKAFFPENAVEYFVSYYDYYQPEAYVPSTDTFIEKDSQINDAIDRMRLSATRSLLERNDVIVVASVSCIYGIGSAEAFYGMLALVEEGQALERDMLLRKLVSIQYRRNDHDFHRGTFRVRGDTVDIFPAYEELEAIRISFFGDEVERIDVIDPLRGNRLRQLPKIAIYPGTLYVLPVERKKAAIESIHSEMKERVAELRGAMRFLEAQRLEERTRYDLEMLETMGFCNGIENYSRHFTGRDPGAPPPCLLDYFKAPWLMVIDESHATLPQVGAMYRGDRSRKETLVEHGFRLPSALDNRPLRFEEFEDLLSHVIHVSATPGDRELDKAGGVVVEQLIRPTGLLDPWIEVRPASTQVDDLIGEIRHHVDTLGDRVLVTVLTKRMAEDLTDYLREVGINVRYLHSDIDTLERVALLRELREGGFDVLVGINLLREGLDLPEVSLVAILDADKEGFLRAHRSLIQTSGRAARNLNGRVLFYGDRITGAMRIAIDETLRRRRIQEAWNKEHGITPTSVRRAIGTMTDDTPAARDQAQSTEHLPATAAALEAEMTATRTAMKEAARQLAYEEAARLRDRLQALERHALAQGLS